jgi:hypothetical protein
MSAQRKGMPENGSAGLSMDEIKGVLKNLATQLKATKRVYFSHRGVVTDTREVPDHAVQLRAAIELVKMHGLYPRRGERESGESYDRSEPPVIKLVMHSPE